MIRPVNFAPESKRISELLGEMRDQNFHMCIIIDEYGSTPAFVTLTQLVEEIVGDVKDELAEVNKDFEIIDDSNFQIDGAMRIEDANAQMNLGLPEGDYDTVAGFVLKLLGHIPRRRRANQIQGPEIGRNPDAGPENRSYISHKGKKCSDFGSSSAAEPEIKFISHLDIVRLWQRAFNRAGIQIAYSTGFTPHPRISLAAPLPWASPARQS